MFIPLSQPTPIVRTARRSLKECADAANNALDRGEKAFVEAGLALKEALDQVPRGQRLAWLKENFKGSKAAAYRLIRACDCFKVRQLGAVADGFSEPVTIPDDGSPQPVTAEKPSGPALCRSCTHRKNLRRPVIKDCPDCAELNSPDEHGDAWEGDPAPPPPETKLPPPTGPVDKEGHTIPGHCREAFEQREEVVRTGDRIQEIIDTLPSVIGKPGWVWVDTGEAGHHLKEARDIIQGGAVEHLCPNCASKPDGCPLCMGRPGVPHRIWKD